MSGKPQVPHLLVDRLNRTMRCKSRETPEPVRPESSPDEIVTGTQTPPRTDQLISPSSLSVFDTSIGQDPRLLLQPRTRPIPQGQLVDEVKGIYAGLVMVEKKCVEIDQQQSSTTNKISNEQWQALIALHRTLLHEHHEHHDFFLASQHPSSSPALRRLAAKYAMPARMWRHGIHSFLELLRHRLPDSLDHMLALVYLAYSMMALLMESVPSFKETWFECLGDLARYRMAIEEADLRDEEVWLGGAKMWYNKAADKSPYVGRIQHHLAVLARRNIVQQLYYYSMALVGGTLLGGSTSPIGILPDVDISPGHHHANGSVQIHKYLSPGDISACQIGVTHEPHSPNPEQGARIGCRLRLFSLAIAAKTSNIFQNFGHIYGTSLGQLGKSDQYSEDILTVRLLLMPARASLDSVFYWARCTLSAFTRHPSLSTKVCLLMSTLPIAYAAPVGLPPPTGNPGRPEAWLNFETICHMIGWVSTCTLGAFIIYLGFRNPRRDLARDHVLSFGSAFASLVLLDSRAPPEVRWATLFVGVVFLVRLWAKVTALYEMGHGWLGPIFGFGILIDTGLVHLTVGASGGDQGLFFQLLLASFCLSLSLCASMARFHRHIYTPNPSTLQHI